MSPLCKECITATECHHALACKIAHDRLSRAMDRTMDVTLKTDAVNHPAHYNSGKIEVIDFIEDQGLNFCTGNVVKYVARAGKKYGLDIAKHIEDLKKAAWYLNREIERLEKL